MRTQSNASASCLEATSREVAQPEIRIARTMFFQQIAAHHSRITGHRIYSNIFVTPSNIRNIRSNNKLRIFEAALPPPIFSNIPWPWTRWSFGPITRGSIGPNGCFPGTFWPKPSLLGCLRSLKNFLVKTLKTRKIFEFWIFGDSAIHGSWVRPRRPPKQAKNPQRRPKT